MKKSKVLELAMNKMKKFPKKTPHEILFSYKTISKDLEDEEIYEKLMSYLICEGDVTNETKNFLKDNGYIEDDDFCNIEEPTPIITDVSNSKNYTEEDAEFKEIVKSIYNRLGAKRSKVFDVIKYLLNRRISIEKVNAILKNLDMEYDEYYAFASDIFVAFLKFEDIRFIFKFQTKVESNTIILRSINTEIDNFMSHVTKSVLNSLGEKTTKNLFDKLDFLKKNENSYNDISNELMGLGMEISITQLLLTSDILVELVNEEVEIKIKFVETSERMFTLVKYKIERVD